MERLKSPRIYERLKRFILPENFPNSVKQPNYWQHSKWTMLEGFLGSAIGVFTTQMMLSAMLQSRGDIISAGSLPFAAATLNWVLKDGLGQLGGILFVATLGSKFDLHPQKLRFLSGMVLKIASLIELSTPLVPRLFLPMAALATALKNVSWMACSASRAPLLKMMSQGGENLGDLTGKAASQLTITSMLGMAFGIVISELITQIKEQVQVIDSFMVVIPLIIMGVFSLWKSCRWAISNRLHPKIIEILVKRMEPPELVSAQEALLPSFSNRLRDITIDAPIDSSCIEEVKRQLKQRNYVVCKDQTHINIWLGKEANNEDALESLLEGISLRDSEEKRQPREFYQSGWNVDGLSLIFKNRIELQHL